MDHSDSTNKGSRIKREGDLTPDQDQGVLKELIREGSAGGESPVHGDKVVVHYVGTLTDGVQFDSSLDRDEPFNFTLGMGQVIKGWDIGVASMIVGEKCKLTIKPEYGYGQAAQGENIPGNSTLIFEVELISIKGEDISEKRDESATKRTLKKGDGYERPNDNASVVVKNLSGVAITSDGQMKAVENRDQVEWVIGEGDAIGIMGVIEECIKRMNKGEVAKVDFSRDHVDVDTLNIPKDFVKMSYTLTLESFEKGKETWNMTTEEKIEAAKITKDKGVVQCRNKNFGAGLKRFKRVLDLLQDISEDDDDTKEKDGLKLLLCQTNSNLAMCCLKQMQYKDASTYAAKAIDLDANCTKALFRRGEARMFMGNLEDAMDDYKKVLSLEPDNTAAKAKLSQCQQKMNAYKHDEQNMFKRMMKGISSGKKTDQNEEKTAGETKCCSDKMASECCKEQTHGCCKQKAECCKSEDEGCCEASKPGHSEDDEKKECCKGSTCSKGC